jgi:hypothetical protein
VKLYKGQRGLQRKGRPGKNIAVTLCSEDFGLHKSEGCPS